LSEFDLSEISRTLNMEKVVVYCLGVIFLCVCLVLDENDFKKESENGLEKIIDRIKNDQFKLIIKGMLEKKSENRFSL
jgi:hypothetical protein